MVYNKWAWYLVPAPVPQTSNAGLQQDTRPRLVRVDRVPENVECRRIRNPARCVVTAPDVRYCACVWILQAFVSSQSIESYTGWLGRWFYDHSNNKSISFRIRLSNLDPTYNDIIHNIWQYVTHSCEDERSYSHDERLECVSVHNSCQATYRAKRYLFSVRINLTNCSQLRH